MYNKKKIDLSFEKSCDSGKNRISRGWRFQKLDYLGRQISMPPPSASAWSVTGPCGPSAVEWLSDVEQLSAYEPAPCQNCIRTFIYFFALEEGAAETRAATSRSEH